MFHLPSFPNDKFLQNYSTVITTRMLTWYTQNTEHFHHQKNPTVALLLLYSLPF